MPWGIVGCLEGLATVAEADGESERAARLFGAAAVRREAVELPLAPRDDPAYETTVATTWQVLGTANFEAAWAEGAALTVPAAISYALARSAAPRPPRHRLNETGEQLAIAARDNRDSLQEE